MPGIVLLLLYYHHPHCHASLLPSSCGALTTILVFFFVPIVPILCRISTHIQRVFAHCRPPRLCSPHTTVSFFPVIYPIKITRIFRFAGAGTPSPFFKIPFLFLSLCANSLLLLSVVTASRFQLWCDGVSVLPVWDTIFDPP